MSFDLRSAAILRMLIYPIQFEADPLNGMNRVMAQVVFAEHTKVPLADFIAAIVAGLGSDATHSEQIGRAHV